MLNKCSLITETVCSCSDMVDLTSCALKMPPGLSSVPTNAYWQSKLESAQNVLFCKELFSQVAYRDCGIGYHFSLLDRSFPENGVTVLQDKQSSNKKCLSVWFMPLWCSNTSLGPFLLTLVVIIVSFPMFFTKLKHCDLSWVFSFLLLAFSKCAVGYC